MTAFVRYFARVQGAAAGPALAYLREIIRIAPVRLVSVQPMELPPSWSPYAPLLATPMTGPLRANVVCTEPEDWCRVMAVGMPATPGGLPAERVTRTIELHTAGVPNLLIMTSVPEAPLLRAAAAKYETIVVPTFELYSEVVRVLGPRDRRYRVTVQAPGITSWRDLVDRGALG